MAAELVPQTGKIWSRTWWKVHGRPVVSTLVLGIIGSIIASFIFDEMGYQRGRSSGYASGHEEGLREGAAKAYKEQTDEAKRQIASLWREYEDSKTADEKQFEDMLREKERQHIERLEETITRRYGERLREVEESAQNRGYSDGYRQGEAYGSQLADRTCSSRIDAVLTHGNLWLSYRLEIVSFVEKRPNTDADIRAMARSIVSVSDTGREAANGLSQQLNGSVVALREELDKGDRADLNRVREIIHSLHRTLESKQEAWQKHLRTIMIGTRS